MKSELEIQKDVMDELKWEAIINAIKPAEIGVAVRGGIVTLTGTVDNYSKKRAAERAVKRVAAVQGIANDLEIKIPGTVKKTDTEIAEMALNALQWNTVIP